MQLGSLVETVQASPDAVLAHAVLFRDIKPHVPSLESLAIMVTVHRREGRGGTTSRYQG